MGRLLSKEKTEQYEKEASEKGYSLDSFITNELVNYTRLSCGHKFTFLTSTMRHQKRNICRECNELKFKAVIENRDIEVIERVNISTFTFKVNKCGHIMTSSIHNLAKTQGPVNCTACVVKEFERRCLELKLEVLENPANIMELGTKVNPHKYAKFLRKDCGHAFIALRHNIKNLEICTVCSQIAKTKLLNNNGYEFVSKTNSNVKSIYKFIHCGHTRVLFDSAALRGNGVCHVCNNTSHTAKSKLYILKFQTVDGLNFLKFGYGKNTTNRIREYCLNDARFIEQLFEVEVETGIKARSIENSIHKTLLVFKFPNEQMKKYLTKSGYSECYPSDLLETLKSEINMKLCLTQKELNDN